MDTIAWEMMAVAGFALAILLGSILLLRARRTVTTSVMFVAGIMQVLGVAGLIASQVLLRSAMVPTTISQVDSYDLFRRIGEAAGLVFMGGLVFFAYGFVKFGLRQVAVERRAEELEGMVRGLSERMEGEK